MNENIANDVSVLTVLDNQCASSTIQFKPNLNLQNYTQNHEEAATANEHTKQNIVWNKNATQMLLGIYETKMHMLDNPKKKSKMWTTIAAELKSMNIEVTPDQVRWKINALTKKYKDCIDNGQGSLSFKYFNEMHQILGSDNNECETYRLASGVMQQESIEFNRKHITHKTPMRKLRAERQAKIKLDNEWIEYIRRQDEQRIKWNERHERSLKLKEEELKLKNQELELKQSLALRRLELKEKKQEELLKIEKEKCALLRKLLANR